MYATLPGGARQFVVTSLARNYAVRSAAAPGGHGANLELPGAVPVQESALRTDVLARERDREGVRKRRMPDEAAPAQGLSTRGRGEKRASRQRRRRLR